SPASVLFPSTTLFRSLGQLQKGELAGPASTEEMIRVLKRQLYFSRLPQRIRFRASVGHKTGDWPPIIGNDVGIIYSDTGPIVVRSEEHTAEVQSRSDL